MPRKAHQITAGGFEPGIRRTVYRGYMAGRKGWEIEANPELSRDWNNWFNLVTLWQWAWYQGRRDGGHGVAEFLLLREEALKEEHKNNRVLDEVVDKAREEYHEEDMDRTNGD